MTEYSKIATSKKALLEWGNVSHIALWKDVFWIFTIYLFVMSVRLCVLQSTAYLLKTESIRWREAMLISGEVIKTWLKLLFKPRVERSFLMGKWKKVKFSRKWQRKVFFSFTWKMCEKWNKTFLSNLGFSFFSYQRFDL